MLVKRGKSKAHSLLPPGPQHQPGAPSHLAQRRFKVLPPTRAVTSVASAQGLCSKDQQQSVLLPSLTTMWLQAHPSLLRALFAQRWGCLRPVQSLGIVGTQCALRWHSQCLRAGVWLLSFFIGKFLWKIKGTVFSHTHSSSLTFPSSVVLDS